MNETTTTTAREGVQTLGIVEAAPVGWDGTEDMPEEYGHMCMALTAETLTRAGMDVLGLLGDTDLVFMEGGEVCVGIVTPLPSQLIEVTKEDVEESLSNYPDRLSENCRHGSFQKPKLPTTGLCRINMTVLPAYIMY